MKRIGQLLLASALLLPAIILRAQTSVRSPDKKITLTLTRNNQQLQYQVSFNGKPVINASAMDLQINGEAPGVVNGTGKPVYAKVNETYDWRGVHSKAVNHYNEVT